MMCPLIAELLEKYQDRILYDSDFPNIIFPREEEINSLLGLNLSSAFYDKIFWTNGWRLIQELTNEKILKSI
jgi:hypothetical protein